MLSVIVFLPVAGGLAAALLCRWGVFRAGRVAIIFAFATFALSISVLADFDSGQSGLQHLEDFTWISELGIHYRLGVDGLNLFLILLTTLLWVVATAGSLASDR